MRLLAHACVGVGCVHNHGFYETLQRVLHSLDADCFVEEYRSNLEPDKVDLYVLSLKGFPEQDGALSDEFFIADDVQFRRILKALQQGLQTCLSVFLLL